MVFHYPHDLVAAGIIEDHFHNRERWCGISADQNGNNWADFTLALNPFHAISGNNTWGADCKVIGTDDTPRFTGGKYQDYRRILFIANSSATVYKIRHIYGLTTPDDAIAAGQYSEMMYFRGNADQVRKIQEIWAPRVPSGYKRWMRIWNATNLATMDFFVGLHEYST